MKAFITLILCAFAFAQSNAQIVYTDVKPDSVIRGSYNLDLDNDGVTDFVIQQSAMLLTCGRTQISKGVVSIIGANGNNAVINDGTGYALALNYASAIVPDSQWSASSQVLFNHGTSCANNTKGYWVYVQKDQYLGLRFTKNNTTYYGWARLYAGASTVLLKDYAYDSIAGQTISAGQGGSMVFPQTAPAIQWQKSLGGASDDFAYSVKQTSDGGYIVAGTSYSNDGDVTGSFGGIHDYWVVKLNSSGTVEWQKSLAHTANAGAYSIQQTADGGYIVAGSSDNSGFITDNHGDYDCLIIKLTNVGDIEWQKSLGGSGGDGANSIQQTADGGYIVAGSSGSNDGDVSGNHGGSDANDGGSDCWVVKLNRVGSIEWQKCLGGSRSDVANSIEQTIDGGYIVAGTTNSQNGDVTGWHQGFRAGGHLTNDYWIVKLNSSGTIEWQKSLGGTGDENAFSVQQAIDGGYIVVGWSDSNDGDVTDNHGYHDCWVVKLNNNGAIAWQESLGSSATTEYAASVQLTGDNGYVVAGISVSNDGDVSGNHGGIGDYWIVKLNNIGNIQWQKCLGGSGRDVANSIEQTNDGGYIIAGNSGSNDGDASGNHGEFDYWIVKLSSDFTLPIQLISFTGTLENNIAKLNWQSGTEENFKQFELEKSTDGKIFTTIATIAAKGSNSSYTYSTPQKESIAFYRLKITDIDAKFTYSKVTLLTQSGASVSIKISPVPAHDAVTIAGAENFTAVQFIDAGGRIVKQFGKMPDNLFPVADLNKGVYFIRLVSGSDNRIFKIIKE